MHRRDFLKTTGAAALACSGVAATMQARAGDAGTTDAPAALAAPAVHDGPRTLHLASPLRDTSSNAGDHVRRLARRLEIAAHGRWRIAWTSETAAEAVDLTIAEFGAATIPHPASAYFAGLPSAHALDIGALEAWLAVGGGQHLWDELAAGYGLKFLLAGHSGAAPTLWSRTPLVSPADLVGRSIALRPVAHALASGLGAIPVELDAERVVGALAAGAIDIAETPDASLAARGALAAVTAHGFASPFQPHGASIALGVRQAVWEGFTAGERMMLEALAAESLAHARAQHAGERTLAAALAHDLPGAVPDIQPLPEDIARVVSTIAASVIAGIAGHDRLSRRIDLSYMAFRRASPDVEPVALS